MSAKRSLSRRPSSSSRSALESASGGRERTRSACRDTVNRCRIRSRYTTPRFSANARHALLSPICGMSAATALIAPPGSGRLRSAAPVPHIVFLGIDDQLRVLELAAQTGVLAIELLNLPGRRIRLRPPSLWGQRHAIGRIHLLAPAREHRGINALAAQERAEGAGLLATVGLGEQRALLAGRELAAPGGRDNLRVGCRRGPGHPFTRPTGSLRDAQGRSRGSAVHRRVHYCCHLWILPLDTKLPKAVVPGHIGTQGARRTLSAMSLLHVLRLYVRTKQYDGTVGRTSDARFGGEARRMRASNPCGGTRNGLAIARGQSRGNQGLLNCAGS